MRMEPLIVRLLVPLGVAVAIVFLVDFALSLPVLRRPPSEVSERLRRRSRLLGLSGIALVTILSLVGAATFVYRRSEQQKVTKVELCAFFLPLSTGIVSGLVLKRIERSNQASR